MTILLNSKSKLFFMLLSLVLALTLKPLAADESIAENTPKPQQVFVGLQASPEIIELSQNRNLIYAQASMLNDQRIEAFTQLETDITAILQEFETTHDQKLLQNKMVKILLPLVKELKDISDSSNELAAKIRQHKAELVGIELFSPESIAGIYQEYEQEKKNLHLSTSTVNLLVEEQYGGDVMKLEEAASKDPLLKDYVDELMTLGDLARDRLKYLRDNLTKIKDAGSVIIKLGTQLDSTWVDIRQFKRNTYVIASTYRSWAETIKSAEIGDILQELTNGYINLKNVTESMTVISFKPNTRFEEIINQELTNTTTLDELTNNQVNSASGLGDRIRTFLGKDPDTDLEP